MLALLLAPQPAAHRYPTRRSSRRLHMHIARHLNRVYEAWNGEQDLPIGEAGILVHSTRWPGLPGPLPYSGNVGRRYQKVAHTILAGENADATHIGLTLINRRLATTIGKNQVALESWAWNTTERLGSRYVAGGSLGGLILLASANHSGIVRCGIARDGFTDVRIRGCGCTTTASGGAALSLAVPLAEHYGPSIADERPGHHQWGQCQHDGGFWCDELQPKGMHSSATDGSCVVDLANRSRDDVRPECGTSMHCARGAQTKEPT